MVMAAMSHRYFVLQRLFGTLYLRSTTNVQPRSALLAWRWRALLLAPRHCHHPHYHLPTITSTTTSSIRERRELFVFRLGRENRI